MADAEVVFCADLTGVPEAEVAYAEFWHEAEVFFYPLANAVEAGEMGSGEAREAFAPYRDLVPWIYDPEEMEEHENGFPSAGWFAEWGPGPGSEDFWREADALGIPGVVYSEGDHPGGSPYFEVRRREALSELRERLGDRYEIVVRPSINDYDTSGSLDAAEAKGIVERGRGGAADPPARAAGGQDDRRQGCPGRSGVPVNAGGRGGGGRRQGGVPALVGKKAASVLKPRRERGTPTEEVHGSVGAVRETTHGHEAGGYPRVRLAPR